MSDPIIRIENLGKKYQLKHAQPGPRYRALRDVLGDGLRSGFGLFHRGPSSAVPSTEEFWALKDVSLDIQRGDVVGIIGRNGAGKSTLLKILSRITEPTTGRVTLNGRVASLLEVGTGFHPELTGRENIFLNGAILGMSRAEIRRKFDEIVAFAEVEKFLDTPVKRYSSGMYVRLAFAVAAHLEPEILIVDEVLAVGDAEFQKKCLGKMGEVARGGRTVLFVSHNMAAVSALCARGVVLRGGAVLKDASAGNAIAAYFADLSEPPTDTAPRSVANGQPAVVSVAPSAVGGQFRPDEPKVFNLRIAGNAPDSPAFLLAAHVTDAADQLIVQCNSVFLEKHVRMEVTEVRAKLVLHHPWLRPGEYWLDTFILDPLNGVVDRNEKACRFTVLPLLPYPAPGPESSATAGQVLAAFDWEIDQTPHAN
jgi:ABC-type polysaccharide/polyol phosphate transport system ATPase subunit